MSDYLDNLQKTTASNYSMQPGSIHESFPAQASGGQSEHSDSEGDLGDRGYSDNRMSLNKPGNSMLRDRNLGPMNAKTNVRNGYTGSGQSYGMDTP